MTARSLGVLLAVVTLSPGRAAAGGFAGQAAPPAGGSALLALHVTCDGQGDSARLHIQIANTAGRETAFVLGFTPASTQVNVVDSFDVFAIRPATGADEDFVYVNPKYALATGAPWVVSLAAGKAYELDLPVTDFISRLNYSNLDVSVAAGARLVLDARPAGKAPARIWTGKAETRIDRCH